MTGRNEVAISPRDYKFYAPRHKYRRASNPISNITGLSVSFDDPVFIIRILFPIIAVPNIEWKVFLLMSIRRLPVQTTILHYLPVKVTAPLVK